MLPLPPDWSEDMKRVAQYRKVFESAEETTLKELKKKYRDLVKEWHPDKFQSGDPKAKEAELKSQEIIEAYHFLVSIAPETRQANQAEYAEALASGLSDFKHKGLLMEVTFANGATYEYLGVNEKLFIQFYNADKPMRFGKRKIFSSFLYRKTKKEATEA